MDRNEPHSTPDGPPVAFGPGWRVPTSTGARQVTLQPAPIGDWAHVDVAARYQTLTWSPVDGLAEAATATIDGLGRVVTVEARRVVSDFSSFVRSPRFRGRSGARSRWA